MELFFQALLLLQLVSVLGMWLCNRHALACWDLGYRRGTDITTLTRWHPLYAGQWFASERPSCRPSDLDKRTAWVFALTPLLNTAMLTTVLLAVGISLLHQAASVRFGTRAEYRR